MSEQPPRKEVNTPRPGSHEAFALAEARAREILRERGFTEEQIEIELHRTKRAQLDD